MDYNTILNRTHIAQEIKQILGNFDAKCKEVTYKKGIYIYGSSGCGKTQFVTNLLTEMNYDIIKYDAGDVRNKALIETITSNNISNRNVLDMMCKRVKKIAIVMDEIDGMNNGDKGGITSLIKLIRQKKTKKQRLENITLNPIICIGNYNVDKKIRELMKVCNIFELKAPTPEQTMQILRHFPVTAKIAPTVQEQIINYIQGDMRKLDFILTMYKKNPECLMTNAIHNIFQIKSYNDDAKKITNKLINKPIPLLEHNIFMNETDRTIVALLYHENIVDALSTVPVDKMIPFYVSILDNMCFADYIDRITFQNQIWIFNEMSSLIKTFYNNKLYHDTFPEKQNTFHPTEIRFTKVLTKYSTEYNNQLFIYNLCQELDMERKDLVAFFQELRIAISVNNPELSKCSYLEMLNNTELLGIFEKTFDNFEINKLDIRRMYRFLDRNVKKEVAMVEDLDEDDLDLS